MSKSLLASAVVLAVLATGCANQRPLATPPGPIYYQQQNASLHDPYADTDLGPNVVGSRPRDFQKPMAEPVRNRRLYESWGW